MKCLLHAENLFSEIVFLLTKQSTKNLPGIENVPYKIHHKFSVGYALVSKNVTLPIMVFETQFIQIFVMHQNHHRSENVWFLLGRVLLKI